MELKIQSTKEKLIGVCNESELPAGVLALLFKDLFLELEAIAANNLKQQALAAQELSKQSDPVATE
jgi:hypothetical protein